MEKVATLRGYAIMFKTYTGQDGQPLNIPKEACDYAAEALEYMAAYIELETMMGPGR